MQQLGQYKHLSILAEKVGERNLFQKKYLNTLFEKADDTYFAFAEDVVSRMLEVIEDKQGYTLLADLYLAYTKQIRIEELYYAKEKKYRHADYAVVYDKVYSDDAYMFKYAVGLGLTQIFWATHYKIFRYYLDNFLPRVTQAQRGAEVGVGHGLFHAELLRAAPDVHTFLLDISRATLNTTRKMIAATGIDVQRTTPVLQDVQKAIPLDDHSLDVLLMGEFIEHIQESAQVMRGLSQKMTANGLCYFSTAANAPAEDHILLFRTTDEIRQFICGNGWDIVDEKCITLNDMPLDEAEAGGHSINFCGTLKKA